MVFSMKDKRNVWIICDDLKFDSNDILQLVSKGATLADKLDTDVSVICIGKYNEDSFNRLIKSGADNIIFCENNIYDERIHTNIIESMIHDKKPRLLIFPASQFAKGICASLSSRFETGLTAECIDIDIENDEIIFSRAALSNSIIARIKCINSKYEMCSIKKNVFTISEIDVNRAGKIEIYKYSDEKDSSEPLIEVLERKKIQSKENVNLSAAKIVFGVGRGIKNKETLELIKSIAKEIGAEVVGTRALVDEGIIEKERQVGQSGIIINPDIYVAFGIFGATQHMVGIKNTKIIIAVNSDKNAPIFDYADYAIEDDLNSVLIELRKLIEK